MLDRVYTRAAILDDAERGDAMTPERSTTHRLDQVERSEDGGRWTLVFVRTLRHPPERVWAALTEPEQLREWAPYDADRDLGRSGDATLTMIDRDSRHPLPATVTHADAPALLEYSLGTDLLRWELAPVEAGTRLTLRHTVESEDWLPKVAAGWHLCLDVAEHLLDRTPIAPIRGDEAREHGWDELHDAYAERLGVAGSGWPEAPAG
jgi:uncharacterized protein YndB with AHSA1/START domain